MSLSFTKNNLFLYDDADFADCQLIQFRLTDSALRDLENLACTLGEEKFQLCISGSKNSFVIPLSDRISTFTFSITDLSSSNDGSFDCLRICRLVYGCQISVALRGRIRCLGKVECRFTVNAKEDSFSMAREKMVQLEDVSRRSQTKDLTSCRKQPRRFGGQQNELKRHSIPRNASGLADPRLTLNHGPSKSFPLTSSSLPHGAQSSTPNDAPGLVIPGNPVSARSLRERVIHILALRPYQRPELLSRLKRDGLSQLQEKELDGILSEVGRLGQRSAYYLFPSAFSELDPHWPSYSSGERNRILTLKNGTSATTPTGSPRNKSRVGSPSTADDQFSRRPTRASAPSAPHALSKKIAALDLLAQGVSENDVTCRLGVSKELLSQWRSAEPELRQRFARQNKNSASSKQESSFTMTNTSSTQISQSMSNEGPFHLGTSSPSDDECAASPTVEGNISPKRARFSDNNPLQLPQGSEPISVTQNPASAARSKAMKTGTKSSYRNPDRQYCGSNLCDLNRPSSSHTPSPVAFRETLHQTIYVHQQHQGHFGSGGSGGSEGESAAHTPCSNISSGSSTYGAIPTGQLSILDKAVRRSNGINFQQTNVGAPRPMACDLDEPSNVGNVSQDNDNKEQGENSTVVATSGESEDLQLELSSKFAEIDRLFPKISDNSQVGLYEKEFNRIYPDFLHMYHTFSNIWKAVRSLRSRLKEAVDRNGLDSLIITNLTDQLNSVLQQTRNESYREGSKELSLKSYTLRLIKYRLSEFSGNQPRSSTLSKPFKVSGETRKNRSSGTTRSYADAPPDQSIFNRSSNPSNTECCNRSSVV